MIYLSKEKLTEELNKTPMIAQHIDCMDLFDAITNSVAENVAEVVRCNDCLYGEDFDIDIDPYVGYQCAKGYGSHLGDWFCADGRKR